jgi:hypothetical protein
LFAIPGKARSSQRGVEASIVPDDRAAQPFISREAAAVPAEIFFQRGSRKFHRRSFRR